MLRLEKKEGKKREKIAKIEKIEKIEKPKDHSFGHLITVHPHPCIHTRTHIESVLSSYVIYIS